MHLSPKLPPVSIGNFQNNLARHCEKFFLKFRGNLVEIKKALSKFHRDCFTPQERDSQ